MKVLFLCLLSVVIGELVVGCKATSKQSSESKDVVSSGSVVISLEENIYEQFEPDLLHQLVIAGYRPEANCVARATLRDQAKNITNTVVILTPGACTLQFTQPAIMLASVGGELVRQPGAYGAINFEVPARLFVANPDGSPTDVEVGRYMVRRHSIDALCFGERIFDPTKRESFYVRIDFGKQCDLKINTSGEIEGMVLK